MKKKLIIGIVTLLFVVLSSTTFGIIDNSSHSAYAYESQEKVYCNASLKDDFTDDTVIIVLNGNASRSFRSYSAKDFPELELLHVADLTELTGDLLQRQLVAERTGDWSALKSHVDTSMLIKTDDFRRILSLTKY